MPPISRGRSCGTPGASTSPTARAFQASKAASPPTSRRRGSDPEDRAPGRRDRPRANRAETRLGRRDQDRAEAARADSESDARPGAALPVARRRHAEPVARLGIEPARGGVACLIERSGDGFRTRQRLGDTTRPLGAGEGGRRHTPVTSRNTRWKWERAHPRLLGRSVRAGGVSAASIRRQARATASRRRWAGGGSSGRQRRQGRKPAARAAAPSSWKRHVLPAGRAGRRNSGAQYTPVVRTA